MICLVFVYYFLYFTFANTFCCRSYQKFEICIEEMDKQLRRIMADYSDCYLFSIIENKERGANVSKITMQFFLF